MSIEDFAAHLGTSKQRIIEWEAGSAYPDAVNRRRLAEASRGRWTPDQFERPSQPDRLAALEEEVARLRAERDSALEEVVARLAGLEANLVSAGLLKAPRKSADKVRRR